MLFFTDTLDCIQVDKYVVRVQKGKTLTLNNFPQLRQVFVIQRNLEILSFKLPCY